MGIVIHIGEYIPFSLFDLISNIGEMFLNTFQNKYLFLAPIIMSLNYSIHFELTFAARCVELSVVLAKQNKSFSTNLLC